MKESFVREIRIDCTIPPRKSALANESKASATLLLERQRIHITAISIEV